MGGVMARPVYSGNRLFLLPTCSKAGPAQMRGTHKGTASRAGVTQIRRHFRVTGQRGHCFHDGATQTLSRCGAGPPPSPPSAAPFSFRGESYIPGNRGKQLPLPKVQPGRRRRHHPQGQPDPQGNPAYTLWTLLFETLRMEPSSVLIFSS